VFATIPPQIADGNNSNSRKDDGGNISRQIESENYDENPDNNPLPLEVAVATNPTAKPEGKEEANGIGGQIDQLEDRHECLHARF